MSAYYSSQNIGVGGGQQTPGNYSITRSIVVGIQSNVGPTAAPNSQGLLPQNANIQTNTNVTLGLVNSINGSVDKVFNSNMSSTTLDVNHHNGNVLQVAGPELGLPHNVVYQ